MVVVERAFFRRVAMGIEGWEVGIEPTSAL
jgi:hypothetical protein